MLWCRYYKRLIDFLFICFSFAHDTGAGFTLPYWDFSGSTMVTGNYIRLTPDIQSRSGCLWNSQPVMSQNWEVNVNFKVSGKGKDLYGDGLAIWYAKERLVPGTVNEMF